MADVDVNLHLSDFHTHFNVHAGKVWFAGLSQVFAGKSRELVTRFKSV